MTNLNQENLFLLVLSSEQDILDKILSKLDKRTILALGHCCQESKNIFYKFGVWQRLVKHYSYAVMVQGYTVSP